MADDQARLSILRQMEFVTIVGLVVLDRPIGLRIQRLGRLLRPKESGNTASFYTLIARDTVDQDFAQNRQRFLAEQGYSYTILDADGIAA